MHLMRPFIQSLRSLNFPVPLEFRGLPRYNKCMLIKPPPGLIALAAGFLQRRGASPRLQSPTCTR